MDKLNKLKIKGLIQAIIGFIALMVIFCRVGSIAIREIVFRKDFIILFIIYCLSIFIISKKLEMKNNTIQSNEDEHRKYINSKLGIFQFFTPIILSLLLACVILGIGFIIIKNKPETYYDIVGKELALHNTNKSGELKVIWLSFFIGTFSTFIFNKIYKRIKMIKNINTIDDVENSNIYLAVVGIFIIPVICLWFIKGSILTFIATCGGVFIALLLWQEKTSDIFLKENDFAMKVMISIVTTYYSVFGVMAFVNSMTLRFNFSNRMLQTITFFIVILIWSIAINNKNIKFIDKMILVEQSIIPTILFIYLINRYKYEDKIIKLDYPKNYAFIILAIISVLTIYSILKMKKMLIDAKRIKSTELIMFSTIIVIAIYSMYRTPSYIFSSDLWHTGEELLPWHQIVDKGLTAYKDYFSEAGLFPMYFGFIHNVLLDGTALSYNFAWTLQYVFVAIITGTLLYYSVGGTFSLIISALFITKDYNRPILFIPIILLLANKKIIKKPIYWIEIWILCCFICGIYYPVYGVAIALGTLPFAIGQVVAIIKEIKSGNIKIDKLMWIFAVIEGAVIISSIPLLLRMIKHTLLMSSQSTLADGISVVGKSTVPDWFWNIFSKSESVRQLLYCIFEFSIPIFLSIVYVFLLYLFIRNSKNKSKLEYIQEPLFLLLCTGAISLPVTYLYGFMRMDADWFLARASVVIILFTGTILPVTLWKYGGMILRKSTSMLLMGISFGITILLIGSGLGNEASKLVNKFEVSDKYVYADGQKMGIKNLGSGFIQKDGLNLIKTLNEVKNHVLKEDETFFAFSRNQGLYYILDQKTAVPDSAIRATGDGKTQRVNIDELIENPPMLIEWDNTSAGIADNYLAIKNYYIYAWMIEEGYVPYSKNGVKFFIHPDRYEEVFGDLQKVQKEMIEEYDTSYFTRKDIQGLPNAWGKSMESLEDIFDEYKKFDTSNLNIKVDSLEEINENGIKEYKASKGTPSFIINFEESVYGKNADFLFIDINIKNNKKNQGKINIYWKSDLGNLDGKRAFTFNIGDGKLLIPLGAHPGWLFANNEEIRIRFDDCSENMSFSINDIKLLKLNREWMLD